jgi:hypothetical protein
MHDIINSIMMSLYELGQYGPYDYPDRIGSKYCKFCTHLEVVRRLKDKNILYSIERLRYWFVSFGVYV